MRFIFHILYLIMRCAHAIRSKRNSMKRTMQSSIAALLAAIFMACLSPLCAKAEEGMWTFDKFPSKAVATKYGFSPSQAWLDRVRMASLRIEGGCSASFISPDGLVLTNHHCVSECIQQLSTPQQNFVETGFSAKTAAEERKCPNFELDQLIQIRDVTADMQNALAGKTGDAADKALHVKAEELEWSCGSDPDIYCDVVSLYHGRVYNLYRYKRYTDVRLVFAPEFAVAQFGGDPDNFNFPRFDFDIGLLRAYETNKAAATPDYLRWSANGSKEGDLVFVSGNPGDTNRELTMSQLEFERDRYYPLILPSIAEYRGQLEQFMMRGPEQARQANEDLFAVENTFKALYGEHQALLDPQFMAGKQQEEQRLRAAAAADPKLSAYAAAWDDIAKIQKIRAQLFIRQVRLSDLVSRTRLLDYALTLVQAAEKHDKSNKERLRQNAAPALDDQQEEEEEELSAPVLVYKDLEELNLAFAFTIIRRDLGTDDAFVRTMLGMESPEQLAHRLVSGTKLEDPKVRMELYRGGAAAVAASSDPMIRFAASINREIAELRKNYRARVDAPTRAAAEKIAKARFAIYGASISPDANFTARLSYGSVKGFEDADGKFIEPFTTIEGLFRRATGAPPYVLPKSWLAAKSSLNLSLPLNLATTNDIVGGNSGSPLIDKDANIVGLIFDGNIFSLSGNFGYDADRNRAVAVDVRTLIEGMQKVYHLDRIVGEIEAARR
jgi:hypothetical protein